MKKHLIYILFLLIILTGCSPKGEVKIEKLTIFALNDFHGDVLDETGNLSIIGNYLITEKEKSPESTIILASGDMFQGSAISNMTNGKVVLESMEEIGFDSMTVGNHEFDWGVDVLSDLASAAQFPFLGANIYSKETNDRVNWLEPYTIIQKGNIKVGIIGIIGEALTTDISPSIIEPFKFVNEFETVTKYTKILRTEKDCDIIIVSAHNNTEKDNQRYADLSGEYQIDAIFNAHSHSNYYGEILGEDGIIMPYVQSGSVGQYIGKVEIQLDNNKMKDGSAYNLRVSNRMSSENTKLNAIIKKYEDQTNIVSSEVLGISGREINRGQGTSWAVDALRKATNVDIAVINTGGIRANGFPIYENEAITVGHLWLIMPFDNIVKTVDMKAKDLNYVMSAGVILSSNASNEGGIFYINGNEIDPDTIIKVATIDYLFDNKNYNFINGTNQVNTGTLFRDVLINNVREVCADGSKFYAYTLYR